MFSLKIAHSKIFALSRRYGDAKLLYLIAKGELPAGQLHDAFATVLTHCPTFAIWIHLRSGLFRVVDFHWNLFIDRVKPVSTNISAKTFVEKCRNSLSTSTKRSEVAPSCGRSSYWIPMSSGFREFISRCLNPVAEADNSELIVLSGPQSSKSIVAVKMLTLRMAVDTLSLNSIASLNFFLFLLEVGKI